MKRERKAWTQFIATRIVGVAVDSGVMALAYLAAVALRFDFREPFWGWRATALSFVMVLIVQLAAMFVCGCYHLAWRRISAIDLPRYLGAAALGAAALTAMRYFLPDANLAHVRPPYSITVMFAFLFAAGVVGVRFLWRSYWASRRCERELLERDERTFDNTTAARYLAGRAVLVTGAGGTIGSEICSQVAAAGAKRVLLVERCENALYEIDRRLRREARSAGGAGTEFIPLMVDCGEREKMDAIFERYAPSIVLHAAAYKHVPMVELNPEEGRRNNTGATKTLGEVAKAHGVERFVMISTDKAVNPVSVMGKTKRAAEMAIMAMNSGEEGTSFCAVRFGNVLGSSGSVVPLFKEQIARREAVTVTHPDMKRYFMTVREAVSLVLQAASRSERAIYTLDMGESVRIVDLAESMIRAAGYRPYVDIPITFTGIRPGEKLFEELDISEKSAYRTDMAKIYITRDEGEAKCR